VHGGLFSMILLKVVSAQVWRVLLDEKVVIGVIKTPSLKDKMDYHSSCPALLV
jgi:hypothetical protein